MPERPSTSLERLRESVAIRVQEISLRVVARQVGMSPAGLQRFIAGGVPFSRSRQKLQDWWMREGRGPRSDVSTEGVEVAMGALVRDLPPERRAPAIGGLVRSLRGSYELQGGRCPPWLEELCERWVAGGDSEPPPSP